MAETSKARLRPFLIWKFLYEDSDKNHMLSTSDILKILEERGIACERRALERDIDALIQHGEPIRKKREKNYKYYFERHYFEEGEISLLLDCIQSATFLTEGQTWDFMKKIAGLGGGGEKKVDDMLDNILLYSVNKTENPEVLKSVSVISEAIAEKKMISFRYFNRNEKGERVFRTNNIGEEKLYIAIPQKKTINNGLYYLLAKIPNQSDIVIYRIDRMADVRRLDESFESINDWSDLERYKKHMFEMYGGKEICVTLCIHKDFVKSIFDFFSPREITLEEYDDAHYKFTCSVIESPMFIAWCCSYGKNVKVLAPAEFVEKVSAHIQSLSDMYAPEKGT